VAEGTDVTLDAVREFAVGLTKDSREGLTSTFQQIGPVAGASVGTSGVPGSGAAKAHYQQLAQSLSLFLVDVGDNVAALTNVATLVAWNYQHGDTGQQAQMNTVTSALDPAPGTETIHSKREAEQQAAAAEQRRLAQLYRRMGEQPPGSGYTTPSGVTLTGPAADAARAQAAEAAQDAATPADGVAGMTTAQRMALVNSTVRDHQEDMRQASATQQITGYDENGNPVVGMVAPDTYQEASGAGEENTSTAGEYDEAQDWAEQERADGYDASVTVGTDGEVHRETSRPPVAYNDWSQQQQPYSSPSVGG
jgi:hypothetical protein